MTEQRLLCDSGLTKSDKPTQVGEVELVARMAPLSCGALRFLFRSVLQMRKMMLALALVGLAACARGEQAAGESEMADESEMMEESGMMDEMEEPGMMEESGMMDDSAMAEDESEM